MKRVYSYQASRGTYSSGPPQYRIKHNNVQGDAKFKEDGSTKFIPQKVVADHYNARTSQTLEEREASPIIGLRKLNNWIKSVLIQLHVRHGDAVLDLACGKGGDLKKWDKAGIRYYVGIDIAQASIEDCRRRYHGIGDCQQQPCSFPARLICGDCFEIHLDESLADDGPFDVCSCQFAMHYSWSTEARARRALANISTLLRPGGVFIGTMPDANVIVRKLREAQTCAFGNTIYQICFDQEFATKKFKRSSPFGIQYTFRLEDAVDCPEWVVPFPVFKSLAEEYGLDLVFAMNQHEFVERYLKEPEFTRLMATMMRSRSGQGGGIDGSCILSPDEWEVAFLYMAFAFKKRG